MHPGISTRLFLAILASAAISVMIVSVAGRWNFERSFVGYLDQLALERMEVVLPRLARAYQANGSWAFLDDPNRPWYKLLRAVPDGVALDSSTEAAQAPDLIGVVSRLGLVDAEQRWVAGYRETGQASDAVRRAVLVDDRTVGWLVLAPIDSVVDGGGARFARDQLRITIVVALLVVAFAGAIAWWVTRRLLAPIRDVAAATNQLAAGRWTVRVPLLGDDEVAQLARDFNRLADTLEQNEATRRAFMADVSHELRTPLGVLRGELEAIEDGVQPLDRTAIKSLQAEVSQLGQLVDDLYELALSDIGALKYQMEPTDLAMLISRVVESRSSSFSTAGLRLDSHVDCATPAVVRGDPQRLQQLFNNLLVNSQRYTDPGGRVSIRLHEDATHWTVDVDDSAPGLRKEQFGRLFDRLFRADPSRSRATGGAGLGLAISRNIVVAHGGTIEANASSLGGIRIRIALPRLA